MKTGKRFNLKDFLKENWIALIPYVMFVIMFAVMGVLNSSTLTSALMTLHIWRFVKREVSKTPRM